MTRNLPVVVTTLGVLALPVAVYAAPITLTNASFESVVLADGASVNSTPGWTRIGTSTLNPTAAQLVAEAYDGQNVALFTGGELLTQTVGTIEYGTYTLTAAIGNPLGFPLGGLGLSLRRGTTFLQQTSSSLVTPADGMYSLLTVIYTVTSSNLNGDFFGENLNILALSSGSGTQVVLDDVRLDLEPMDGPTAVPEPASLGLLGLGALVLGLTRVCRGGRRAEDSQE